MIHFDVISIPGQKSFQEVYQLQMDLLSRRIADEIPDTIIFCEHTPTITRGRGLQHNSQLQKSPSEKQKPLMKIPSGTEYVEIERGGDLTWHGPGQLVIYPIVKLGGSGTIGSQVGQDVEKWIRFLENQWIAVLKNFGIEAKSKPGGSGVWISPNSQNEKKIASVGIALRRWVSFHGIAFNVVNELIGFQTFDPCGFSSQVMVCAKNYEVIPRSFFSENWRPQWEKLFLDEVKRSLN